MDIGLEQYLNHPVDEDDESLYIHCLFKVLHKTQYVPTGSLDKSISKEKNFGAVYRTVASHIPRVNKRIRINSSDYYIPRYDMDAIASLLGRTFSLCFHIKNNNIYMHSDEMLNLNIMDVTDGYMFHYMNAISNATLFYIRKVKDSKAEVFYNNMDRLSEEIEELYSDLKGFDLSYKVEVINSFYDSNSTQDWKKNRLEERAYKPYVTSGDLEFIKINIHARRQLSYIDKLCETFEENMIFYFHYGSDWYKSEIRVLIRRILDDDEHFERYAELSEDSFDRRGFIEACLQLTKEMPSASY